MRNYVNLLVEDRPLLSVCKTEVQQAIDMILDMHKNGGKLLLCGNGGSAADSEHIAGELLKGFLLKRTPAGELYGKLAEIMGEEDAAKLQQGVSAVPLPSLVGVGSAFCNDVDPALVYAQLVLTLGKKQDVLFCISTSGNSKQFVISRSVFRKRRHTVYRNIICRYITQFVRRWKKNSLGRHKYENYFSERVMESFR